MIALDVKGKQWDTPSLAQEMESIKRGVVKVQVTTPEAKTKVGTGFIVKLEPDAVYIVTASHVVRHAPHS